MKLNELLNSEVDITIDVDEDRKFITKAEIGDRTIEVRCDKTTTLNSRNGWEVAFTQDGHKYELTGSGKEFEVFSFVKQTLELLVSKRKPEVIKFSADKKDKSRASLYEKILKRFLPKGYSFRTKEEDGDGWVSDGAVEFRIYHNK